MSCLPLEKARLTKHVDYVYETLSGRSCDPRILKELVDRIQSIMAESPLLWNHEMIRLLPDEKLWLARLPSGHDFRGKSARSSNYLYWGVSKSGACKQVFPACDLKKQKKLVLMVAKLRGGSIETEWLAIKELKKSISFFPKVYSTAVDAGVMIEEFAGRTLFEYLSAHGEFVSKDFASIVYQLIKALLVISNATYWKDNEPRYYLDLKPNNICITHWRSGALTLKLIDLESLCKPSDKAVRFSRFYTPKEARAGNFNQQTHAYAVGSLIFAGLDTNLCDDLLVYEKRLTKQALSSWEEWRRDGRIRLTQNACDSLTHAGLEPWATIMAAALAEDPTQRMTLNELKPHVKKLIQDPISFAWNRHTATRHYQLVDNLQSYEVKTMSCPCICGFNP